MKKFPISNLHRFKLMQKFIICFLLETLMLCSLKTIQICIIATTKYIYRYNLRLRKAGMCTENSVFFQKEDYYDTS